MGRSPQSDYFKGWYGKNRVALLSRRKEKYAADPEYRARARASAAKRYERIKGERNGLNPPGMVYRDGGWVYPIGEAAKHIKRTSATIARWERRGWIPKPTVSGGVRAYTLVQVLLMLRMAKFLEMHGGKLRSEMVQLQHDALVVDIASRWKK